MKKKESTRFKFHLCFDLFDFFAYLTASPAHQIRVQGFKHLFEQYFQQKTCCICQLPVKRWGEFSANSFDQNLPEACVRWQMCNLVINIPTGDLVSNAALFFTFWRCEKVIVKPNHYFRTKMKGKVFINFQVWADSETVKRWLGKEIHLDEIGIKTIFFVSGCFERFERRQDAFETFPHGGR